jgi:hypothetical protein
MPLNLTNYILYNQYQREKKENIKNTNNKKSFIKTLYCKFLILFKKK